MVPYRQETFYRNIEDELAAELEKHRTPIGGDSWEDAVRLMKQLLPAIILKHEEGRKRGESEAFS